MGRCQRSTVKAVHLLPPGCGGWHGACGRAGGTEDGLGAALGYCQPLRFLLFAQTRRDKSVAMFVLLPCLQADPRLPKGQMESPKVERSNRATSEDLKHK